MSREAWIAIHGSDQGFDAYDLTGTGVISASDFVQGEAAGRTFDAADTNHDQKLSRDEWVAKYGTEEGFDAYDLDGDGYVDKAEFIQVLFNLFNIYIQCF